MKAVYYKGGGRFTVGVCKPISPGPGEARLEVAYCGVCGTDLHVAHGDMDDRVKPGQVIGHEMSGRVADLGSGVDGFCVGDKIVVCPLDTRDVSPHHREFSHVAPGLRFMGVDTPGAFQESWTVPAATLYKLPMEADLKLAALSEPLAVACHDVRRGEVAAGETTVVIGGGPIGILIGLVARNAGAGVILSEPNDHRRALAGELGLETVDPNEVELLEYVKARTEGAGADVVFEVSGSAAGASAMTELARVRGRIVVVAIFADQPRVRLHDLFWKELQVRGARVYEPVDFERAISLVASHRLPLERLISSVEPLTDLPAVFAALTDNPNAMKILVDCRSES